MTTYRAVFERDEQGVWLVSVPALRGCHTSGRSLSEARANLEEAIAATLGDARGIEVREDVRLPAAFKRAISRARQARAEADARRATADATLRRTARTLTRDARLSLRDAGDLLGLSRQRIQQLVAR